MSYLDGVEGVPRDDGANSAEPAGHEVLHLAGALLLSHDGRWEADDNNQNWEEGRR